MSQQVSQLSDPDIPVFCFGKQHQIFHDNNLKSYDCIQQHPYFLNSSL